MALAVTHLHATATATDAEVYTTSSFSHSANAFLVVYLYASGTVDADSAISDSGGHTWTIRRRTNISGDQFFLATAPTSTAGSITLTYDCTGDAATGLIIACWEVTGHDTSSPFVQENANSGGTGTPSVSFGAALDTDNCYIGFVANAANPAGQDPPASWTEDFDGGHGSPTRGGEGCHRVNGETGTSITWGNDPGVTWRAGVIEIAVAAAGLPVGQMMQMGAGR